MLHRARARPPHRQNCPGVRRDRERPLFDLDATRREVVRQLHALEQQQIPRCCTHTPQRASPLPTPRASGPPFSRAGSSYRSAPPNALAATRDLDTLKRVFPQVQQVLTRDPKTHRAMPIIEVFYAQHLTRLGARETALEAAKRYPFVHPHLQWLRWASPNMGDITCL
ncbi:hypothetical protein EXIGLDRAFT_763499 [Exidia glandulosa HHB12029]|uniref:Uncharacterized protein n=1 Tax=Exidia glandulosa HHB12029 TaxID=1314781 RepID=A0A166B782_EXIGL|nr:hypothetical protein EXIGLDRAFT_763499 [Exidia glandulosa HHB12029]